MIDFGIIFDEDFDPRKNNSIFNISILKVSTINHILLLK